MMCSKRQSRRPTEAVRLLLALGATVFAGAVQADEWEGWLVGAPCADALQIADCPLRHVERTVLLLENGRKLAFSWGEGKGVTATDVDGAYAKKVRLTGELKEGVLQPVKLDLLEKSAEKKFFKGCL